MKYVLLFAALTGANAFAGAKYNAEKKVAIVYAMKDDKVIAYDCHDVSENDVRRPTEETLKTKCGLVGNPVDLATVERNLSQVKAEAISQLKGQKEAALAMAGSDEQMKQQMEEVLNKVYEPLAAEIEGLTGSTYFDALTLEAKVPTVKIEDDAKDIDQEIEAFVVISNQ